MINMELKLSGKLKAENIDEIGRLARSRWYWPRLRFANFCGIFILGGLLWITVAGLVNGENLNWRGIGDVWAIFVLLFAFLYFRAKQTRKKETSAMAAALPDWITVSASGLHFDGPNGANSFRTNDGVKARGLWLSSTQLIEVAMLPISQLTEAERQILHGLLDTHLSPGGETR